MTSHNIKVSATGLDSFRHFTGKFVFKRREFVDTETICKLLWGESFKIINKNLSISLCERRERLRSI